MLSIENSSLNGNMFNLFNSFLTNRTKKLTDSGNRIVGIFVTGSGTSGLFKILVRIAFFTITAEIFARSLVNFYHQYVDRHMNLKFVRRVSERERAI